MRVKDLYSENEPVFSFEFFPPKTPEAAEQLFQTIDDLAATDPGFVSVTYGAGGSTRELTLELVGRIRNEIGIEAVAHLTCVGHTVAALNDILVRLHSNGIENVLALRGDPPRGSTVFVPTEHGFSHASDLVRYIRANHDFCLLAACYPDGHAEAPDMERDLWNLKLKVDAGAEVLVTQLFYDPESYFRFIERATRIGISVPIIPGILPITHSKQLDKIIPSCGASVPEELKAKVRESAEDQDEVGRIGVEWAVKQCQKLLEGGAPGIHFYTLNRSSATLAVHGALI